MKIKPNKPQANKISIGMSNFNGLSLSKGSIGIINNLRNKYDKKTKLNVRPQMPINLSEMDIIHPNIQLQISESRPL